MDGKGEANQSPLIAKPLVSETEWGGQGNPNPARGCWRGDAANIEEATAQASIPKPTLTTSHEHVKKVADAQPKKPVPDGKRSLGTAQDLTPFWPRPIPCSRGHMEAKREKGCYT